jgi:LacI family transcriptional regulator
VSKVLNGRSDVAATTRSHVQSLLRQHDYVGPSARRADEAARGTVELQFENDMNAYTTEIVQGAMDAGAELDVAVVVSNRPPARTSADKDEWAKGLVDAGRRALVEVTSEMSTGHLAALARVQMPVVVIDPISPQSTKVTSVGSTNFAGGMAATEHLLALGHRRIAYVGGPAKAACNRARLHGYRAAMEAAGASVPDVYVHSGGFTYRHGVETGCALLGSASAPTAVFAGCDEIALGVIEAARAKGLRVPEDLSIVGFDDVLPARMASPPLTTVHQPLRQMGGVAVRTALRLAANERIDSHHVELATELVVRASTTALLG